jgi:phage tail-like protein
MMPGIRRDPFLAFNFTVEIEGLIVGGFSEVSGLQVETVIEIYREGGLNDYEHKFGGATRYPSNLVLKHGLTDLDFMWPWHNSVRQNNVQRRNGTIFLMDTLGLPRVAWNFLGAYPVKWTGPELKADSNTIAFEAIELAHRGITRITPFSGLASL